MKMYYTQNPAYEDFFKLYKNIFPVECPQNLACSLSLSVN